MTYLNGFQRWRYFDWDTVYIGRAPVTDTDIIMMATEQRSYVVARGSIYHTEMPAVQQIVLSQTALLLSRLHVFRSGADGGSA